MPDAQAKQKLLELAVAWEELARQVREPNRPFFESRDGQQKIRRAVSGRLGRGRSAPRKGTQGNEEAHGGARCPAPRLNVGEAARQAARDDASSVKPLSCTPRRTARV
jgi:hypothetical protein